MKHWRSRAFFAVFAVFVVSAAMLLTGTAQAITPKKNIKAAFVLVGPVGDAGWNYAHDQGRLYLEKMLPNVQTAVTENVPEGGESERVINQYARRGYNLIFATSFGYMDLTIQVAKKFPDTVFMHCSGFKTAPNVGTYFGRMYQAKYLAGLIAGHMAKTNILGYVAPHPIAGGHPACQRLRARSPGNPAERQDPRCIHEFVV